MYFAEFPVYAYALLACLFSCVFWLFFSKNRLSISASNIENSANCRNSATSFGEDSTITTLEAKVEEKAGMCTSLSCIRCSKSVYSVEKLLKKWSRIEQEFETDPDTKSRIRNGILNTAKGLKKHGECQQEPTLFYLEGLAGKIWHNNDDYSREISILENQHAFDILLKEFMNVYKDLKNGWVSNKVPSGGWYLYYLINQGVKNNENCSKCPRTVEMIEGLKSAILDCAFGNAVFSVLLPGTKIAQHCGPTNVRIRCHMPLQAPLGYFISVAGEQQGWQEGKTLIFDDSFYHEVHCDGNVSEPRVILMIDFWHPSLLSREREMIKSLFSPQM